MKMGIYSFVLGDQMDINIKDILKPSVDKLKEKKLNQLSDYKYEDFRGKIIK